MGQTRWRFVSVGFIKTPMQPLQPDLWPHGVRTYNTSEDSRQMGHSRSFNTRESCFAMFAVSCCASSNLRSRSSTWSCTLEGNASSFQGHARFLLRLAASVASSLLDSFIFSAGTVIFSSANNWLHRTLLFHTRCGVVIVL